MPVYAKLNGVWKEINTATVRVGGVQKNVQQIYVKVSGVWREVWGSALLLPDIYIVDPSMTVAEINSVISMACSAGGAVIYFIDGIYSLTSWLSITCSNIHLVGEGALTALVCNFSDSSRGVIDIRGTSDAMLENVSVTSMTVNGNKDAGRWSVGIYAEYVGWAPTAGSTSGTYSRYDSSTVGVGVINKKGLTIKNCCVQKNYNYGIYLNNSCNCDIAESRVQNNYYGICLRLSRSGTITGNTVQNNNSYGIYLNSSSNNNTVTGNTVQNNNSYGMHLYSSSNNTITGNTVQNNNNYGICLYSSSNNNTVTGNTVQNNNNSGICLNSSNNNTVTGNTVQNNNGGIYLISSTNNTVTGNTVQSNSLNGINLSSSSNNNAVTGNISISNANKNLLVACDSNLILSNWLNENTSISGVGNKVYNNK